MKQLPFLVLVVLIQACSFPGNETKIIKRPVAHSVEYFQKAFNKCLPQHIKKHYFSKLDLTFIQYGLVDIQKIDSSIHIDLRYSGTNNFLKTDVYGDLFRAYLQPEVAEKLRKAQSFLKEEHPAYSLIIFDAARPVSIQQIMWDTIKVEKGQKIKYLSNPQSGSLHNFGAAVDISIIDSTCQELDMGTDFDFFGELAHPEKEMKFINEGKLTKQQLVNRQLLRSIMNKAGFFNIQTEWWHFNACRLDTANSRYTLIK